MSTPFPVKLLHVGIDFGEEEIPVGRLALSNWQIYFSYEASFIERKLEISPLTLPLKSEITTVEYDLFEGLPGVFNDSLPDGWGRLLADRSFSSNGISLAEVTPLDRLSLVGHRGLGALTYKPDYKLSFESKDVNLDDLASSVEEVLEGQTQDVLAQLLALNGSSAGARPKVIVGVSKDKQQLTTGEGDESWLVKFPQSNDGKDAGSIEYVYALMAKKAGIHMSDVHLFPATQSPGYFGTQRFDRVGTKRYHMHTASGLLHSDFRYPSLDYKTLLALTFHLTSDHREVVKMFRLAVFNVLAHNRDDHAKNFSFLMDSDGLWRLSPAYDLTFSSGPRGEQSMMVMGEGKNPTTENLIELGVDGGVKKSEIKEIIDQTQGALGEWNTLAKEYGVSKQRQKAISSLITP
ncbi:MAG: type II toxin-antitoxin system HipA family toxin [Sphaerochaeta sp.]